MVEESNVYEHRVAYTEIEYTCNTSEKFAKEEIKVKVVGDFDKAALERKIRDVKEAAKNATNMEIRKPADAAPVAPAVPTAADMFKKKQ